MWTPAARRHHSRIGNRSPLRPSRHDAYQTLGTLSKSFGTDSGALLTMLYRSTDFLNGAGAPVKNLAHSASLAACDKNVP
jgi:hypothetical protein